MCVYPFIHPSMQICELLENWMHNCWGFLDLLPLSSFYFLLIFLNCEFFPFQSLVYHSHSLYFQDRIYSHLYYCNCLLYRSPFSYHTLVIPPTPCELQEKLKDSHISMWGHQSVLHPKDLEQNGDVRVLFFFFLTLGCRASNIRSLKGETLRVLNAWSITDG